MYLVFPQVPGELEAAGPCPSILYLKSPKKDEELQYKCVRAWTRAMTLIQYWEDAESLYEYGRSVRHYSKLMLFIFYQINLVLWCHCIKIKLFQVLEDTPWNHYTHDHYTYREITDMKA